MKYLLTFSFVLCIVFGYSQIAEEIITESSVVQTESKLSNNNSFIAPVNGITDDGLMSERMVLDYTPIRERDVFWSKFIWGVIDVREKINQPFIAPSSPFFALLVEGIQNGEITAYMGDSDDFSSPMSIEDVNRFLFSVDTTYVTNPETRELEPVITQNDTDFGTIKKFRTKEIWYFDKLHSRMRVRMLGISPVQDKVDENGTYNFELPMFWIYWPEARKFFASKKVYLPGNDATILSWDDYIEMRYFNYYIIKESNVRDYRIEDFPSMAGDDRESKIKRLLQSKKIKADIFNYESDMWSY